MTTPKIKTKKDIKAFYNDKKKIYSYEKDRYGIPERNLLHWMDCDAIDYFVKNNLSRNNLIGLDLSCGTGRLTRSLIKKYPCIFSSDYSFEMLRLAKDNIVNQSKEFNCICADSFLLPFKARVFDFLFTIRFIRHFGGNERKNIYDEINRVLKDSGIFIFDVLNSLVDKTADKRLVYDETYTIDELKEELNENGFMLKDIIAGNINGDRLSSIAKKWKLIGIGRWRVGKIRTKEKYLNSAAYWMVCAQKKREKE